MQGFFNMCMILTLSLFVLNAGMLAFEGKLPITTDSSEITDKSALTDALDENYMVKQEILDYADTSGYAQTQLDVDVSPETDSAKQFWDFVTKSFFGKVLIGYWLIIDKIFVAFPALGNVIKVALGFFQLMGGIYIGSILAALVRGGYNPG